jgi:pyruvate dehydrogenase (quinone)
MTRCRRKSHGLRTSTDWSCPAPIQSSSDLQAFADLINASKRESMRAGQDELEQLAGRLNPLVVKASLGRAALPDDSPFSTGGIGHLGTVPSQKAMHSSDTLLIIGPIMP